MKNKAIWRIISIGIFHTILYLYIVPFVVYPKFGKIGLQFVVFVAIIISVVVLGTIFIEKKNRR